MNDDIVPWWVVWSEEHGGWWAAPSGYTTSLERAARYTEKRALEIEANANRYLPKTITTDYHEIAMPDPRLTWSRRRG